MSRVLCKVCGAENDAWLCRACFRELHEALGSSKSLMHEVSNLATGQTRVYRANGKPDPLDDDAWLEEYRRIPAWLRSPHGKQTLVTTRSMVNLDARELLFDAGNTLSSWARELAESRGVEIPAGDWLTWLTDNADSFRFSEAADQVHDEITYLHRRMVAAVDRSPSRLYAGPCHAMVTETTAVVRDGVVYPEVVTERCERHMYAFPGREGEITCDGYRGDEMGCGAVHTYAERRVWFLEVADDRLMPLREIWEVLDSMGYHVDWETIRKWPRRQRHTPPRLVSRGEIDGVATYRFGEVLDLVRDDETRRGRRRAC